MKNFEKMSDSEKEIVKAIWKLSAPVTITQLLKIFESRQWKVQTMGTFLTRLVDKKILTVKKQKNINYYTAVVMEHEYNQFEAQNMLSSMYEGSLKNFLSALHGGIEIDTEEVEKLNKWFERAKKND